MSLSSYVLNVESLSTALTPAAGQIGSNGIKWALRCWIAEQPVIFCGLWHQTDEHTDSLCVSRSRSLVTRRVLPHASRRLLRDPECGHTSRSVPCSLSTQITQCRAAPLRL